MKFVYRVLFEAIIVTGSTVGEKLTMQPDSDGLKFGDKHRVTVVKDRMTVWDLPKDTSRSSPYTGEQFNAKSLERKKKNIQKMLHGSLEVPEFDIKGETVLQPLYGASKTN